MRTSEGSPAFKFIAALIRPGMKGGSYVAAMFFGNNPDNRGVTFLMELGGLLVIYMAFWYAVLSAFHGMRSNKVKKKGFERPYEGCLAEVPLPLVVLAC